MKILRSRDDQLERLSIHRSRATRIRLEACGVSACHDRGGTQGTWLYAILHSYGQ